MDMRETQRNPMRDRILSVSAELFARNGYHATGVAELCKAVGLGRGAFYHYIGSKDELLYEISRRQVDEMNAFASRCVGAEGDAESKLRELARALMCNIAQYRAQWTVFFREFDVLRGQQREALLAARDQYESYWRQVFEQGASEGTFRVTDDLQLKGVLGMFNYAYLWLSAGPQAPEEVADVFVDLLLSGLRAN
jgi:AcrR family transcriptional regulator